MELKQHPLSAAFPSMGQDDYLALRDDIEHSGQREPIIVLDDMVLDGWHRYRACIELGIKPTQFKFAGDDPVAYVKSQNLHRRHLTGSQRAEAVVACSEWRPAHRPNKVAPGATLSKTNLELAKEAGTGVRTVTDVKAAQKAGLIDPVRDGAMTAKEAAKVARGAPAKPPKKAALEPAPADDGPDEAEIAAGEAAAAADNAALQKLLESDDKLATAYAEIKRLNAELVVVKQARDGYMNKVNEQIKMIKRLQSKLDKAAA